MTQVTITFTPCGEMSFGAIETGRLFLFDLGEKTFLGMKIAETVTVNGVRNVRVVSEGIL